MDARENAEPSLHERLGSLVAVGIVRGQNLPRRERDAWGLVLVVLLADVALTAVGLRIGLAEGNPLMAYAIGVGGILALVLAKALVLVVAGLVRWRRPQDGAAIALGVAIPWLLAVVINAFTIA